MADAGSKGSATGRRRSRNPTAEDVLGLLADGMAGILPAGWPREPGGGWIGDGIATLRIGDWRIRLRVSGGAIDYVDGAVSPEGRDAGYAVLGGILPRMPPARRGLVESWIAGLGPWR